MSRRLIYAANWKMNHGPAAAHAFAERFLELTAPVPDRELWFFPPAVAIKVLAGVLGVRPDVRVGDYLEADGVKASEQLFEAETIVVTRGGQRVR